MSELSLKQIRVKNLELLCNLHGRDAVRQKLGYDDTNYFNQLVTGHGAFGPRTAAKVEKAFGKPVGWLSESHPIEWGDQGAVSIEDFKTKYQELKAMADLLPESADKRKAVLEAIASLSQT